MLPMPAAHVAPPATQVAHEGGLRFTATIRGHRVETDQPFSAGGTDCAVSPLELVGAALGTCAALYAYQFCATRNIPSDGLRIEVTTQHARAPKRIAGFNIRVHVPDALPEQYRAALIVAVRTCPVHNTLTLSPIIDCELV